MAYKINEDECLACGACNAACEIGAIEFKNGVYVIDGDSCVECGTCAENCPVDAIEEA